MFFLVLFSRILYNLVINVVIIIMFKKILKSISILFFILFIIILPFLLVFIFYYTVSLFMSYNNDKSFGVNIEKGKYDVVYYKNPKITFYTNSKYDEYKYCRNDDVDKQYCIYLNKEDFENLAKPKNDIHRKIININGEMARFSRGYFVFYDNTQVHYYKYCKDSDKNHNNCVHIEKPEYDAFALQ